MGDLHAMIDLLMIAVIKKRNGAGVPPVPQPDFLDLYDDARQATVNFNITKTRQDIKTLQVCKSRNLMSILT